MAKRQEKMLLLRYSDYRKNDFIIEHKKVIDAEKYVWMLKIGKKIPLNKLEEIYSQGGILILRSPKAQGSKYYKAYVEGYYDGKPQSSMKYPSYYRNMLDDENIWLMDTMDGSWFKIKSIEEADTEFVRSLVLVSNEKPVEEVLNSTRSSMLYVRQI